MRKKKLALFSIFILISINIYAQLPDIEWQKCLGGTDWDEAYSIQQTSDGGFIVAGETMSNSGNVSGNHGSYDAWVVKLNNSGDIEWQNCLGGTDDDYAYSIQQTIDSGFIVAGYTWSNDGDVSGNHGGGDAWVVKLNSSGTILWQKCLGGTDYDMANSIQQTSDGGFIVAGRTHSNDGDVSGNHEGGDYWVVKLNSSGTILWQKCLGGTDYDDAYSIQQTNDGGFIVAGGTDYNDDVGSWFHGYHDAWVVKLTSSGDIEWQKCLGGTDWDEGNSIQQASDGGFIVAGFTKSNDDDVLGNHGGGDSWVVKLNSSGDIEWQKCLGGTNVDYAYSIQQTSDGGFIVAGGTESNNGDVSGNHGSHDSWVVKLNSSGTILWQKCLGGIYGDYANSIQQTSDGGFIVAGETSSNNGDVSGNHGTNDCWIIKLTPMLIVDAGPDRIICNGDSITIGGTPTASGCLPPYTYLWNNSGSLNDSTIANPIAFPNITTTYTLTVTDSIGNLNTDSVIITVNNVYFFTETDTVCGGKLWHGNTYSVSGTYYDSLITTLGCDSIYALNLTVNPTYEFTSYDTICQGDVYLWHGTYYNLSGIYYDSLITINNCDSVYNLNLFVNPLPYINLGNDTTINISDTININAGSGFNSYLWSNGSIDSIITVYGSMGQGIYSYYVNVTDINGCSNSDTIFITITTEDGYIELNNTIKVNIYPNPVKDKLNIEINGLIDNDLSIEFFDINGEKLLNKNFNSNSDVIYENIDLSNYANGVYFIIIKSSNLIKTEKIIKV